MDKKRNANVQLARVIAMIFIILCHCFNEASNSLKFIGQFLNVGVFIFFIISAYLYSKKNIENTKEWIKQRFIKICVPIYIWLIVVNIMYLITKTAVNFKDNIIYILNLQAFIRNSFIGMQHLWFISIIFVLYLITPILQKYKKVLSNKILFLCLLALYIIGSLINQDIGRYIFYVFIYIFIYGINITNKKRECNFKNRVRYILILILSVTARLIGKYYFDDTLFYTNFIVLITQTLVGLYIFKLILTIKVESNKVLTFFDKYSYYMYIVHYVFCVGPLSIFKVSSAFFAVQIIEILIISILISILLNIISNMIIKKINK